jgi:hypothetical protein
VLLYSDFIVFVGLKNKKYKNIREKNYYIPIKISIKYKLSTD